MDKIIIHGGRRLEGRVRISGSKNAALPILFSALLTEGVNTYTNVPKLRDIDSTLLLLSRLGAQVDASGGSLRIDAGGVACHEAPYDLVRKMRASVLVLGPLVARLKRARVSLPGGCAIGARPINLHLQGLAAMGAEIALEHGYVTASAKRLRGAEITFDIVTVTGTENLMMAAVLAEGTTVLRNAAREPEVVALAEVLCRMGADISGAGTPEITIRGVQRLRPVSVEIIPDRIETGTFLVAASLTGGQVTITQCEPRHVGATLDKLRQVGARIDVQGQTLTVTGPERIASVDIKTQPYPGFATDMQAQFMVLMSVAEGVSVISESIFENDTAASGGWLSRVLPSYKMLPFFIHCQPVLVQSLKLTIVDSPSSLYYNSENLFRTLFMNGKKYHPSTIIEVASLAGVSPSTVSRVFNGTAVVAPATEQRVRAAIAHLNFSPHPAARQLVNQCTNTIGLLLPEISGEFFSPMLRGIEAGVREAGYDLLIHSTQDSHSHAHRPLREHNTDGLIIFPGSVDNKELRRLFSIGFPLILLHQCAPEGVNYPVVTVENKSGAEKLINHLIEMHGRCRISFLQGPEGY